MKKEKLCVFLLSTFFLIFSLVLRFHRLDSPNRFCMDEYYYVPAGIAILNGESDPNLINHPPLAKIMIGVGAKVFGENSFGWRALPIFFGTFGLILTYLITLKLFKDKTLALLSMAILTFSLLWFVMSRIAMLDIFVSIFLLLTLLFILGYSEKSSFRNALFLGVSLGLTLASKWIAVFVLLLFPFLLINLSQEKDFKIDFKNPKFKYFLKHLGIIFGTAFLIYLLSYLPYYLKEGFLSWPQVQWKMLIGNLFTLSDKPKPYSPFSSYAWPFIPSFALSCLDFKTDTHLAVISMIESPLLLWTFIPLIIINFWRALKQRASSLLFLSLSLISLYAPWLILERPKYFFYMTPIIPLIAISLAYWLKKIWEKKWGKLLVSVYLLLLVINFFLAYPIVADLPVSYSYLYKVFFYWPWLIDKI